MEEEKVHLGEGIADEAKSFKQRNRKNYKRSNQGIF